MHTFFSHRQLMSKKCWQCVSFHQVQHEALHLHLSSTSSFDVLLLYPTPACCLVIALLWHTNASMHFQNTSSFFALRNSWWETAQEEAVLVLVFGGWIRRALWHRGMKGDRQCETCPKKLIIIMQSSGGFLSPKEATLCHLALWQLLLTLSTR